MSDDSAFQAAREQYKTAGLEYVPVRAGRGNLVHATTFGKPNRVACGRKLKRCVVVARPLDCPGCMMAVHVDVRPRRKRKRR